MFRKTCQQVLIFFKRYVTHVRMRSCKGNAFKFLLLRVAYTNNKWAVPKIMSEMKNSQKIKSLIIAFLNIPSNPNAFMHQGEPDFKNIKKTCLVGA